MKSLLNKMLNGRLNRWGFLAVLLLAAGATVAGMKDRHYQLGGAFIGNNGVGNIWNALQIPLDPAGRTAAIRVNQLMYTADLAGFLDSFGADSMSEYVGEAAMISRDTAKFGTVAYAKLAGNPPQLAAILVMNGTIKFTGPDNITVTYTVDVYPPGADANLDGYPDVGAVPVVTIPGLEPAKRVPIPQPACGN